MSEKTFIIAEAGVNHNGDIELAMQMIDAAKEAGVDAVKFQTYDTEKIVTREADKAKYQKEGCTEEDTQFEMLKKLELTPQEFTKLADYAKEKDIMFLSSPLDRGSVDLLERIDVPMYKLGSGELINHPLIRYISLFNKPLILSTGMATLEEIKEAVMVAQVPELTILHCVTNYPSPIGDTNLNFIKTLKKQFPKHRIGYSDHTEGIAVSLAAVALGACVIEKHFTLDKNLPGPDHKASIDPEELKQLVTGIRKIEQALGSECKTITPEEKEIMKIARKSLTAITNIPEGTLIRDDMITPKRPGTGVPPKDLNQLIGRKAKIKIPRNTTITWDMIE